MSKFFMWFQGDKVKELKKDIDKLVAKKQQYVKKIDAEIEAINDKIAKIESENKNKH